MDNAYAAAYPDLYRRHWWWRVREEILVRRIERLLDGRREPARILDVGCGAGLFFDALQRFGRVEGIESDPIAIEQAGRWRNNILVGELDDSFAPAAPFDVVLMLDLLEHVAEPEALLRRARGLLAPGGFVLITVPAFNWLWTRHDELNHHVRRYTATQMRQTVTTAGLAVAESTYLFQSLVAPKAIVRIKEALMPGPPSVPSVPGPTINRVLKGWFRTEHAAVRWLPFGTSLMVVATRG